MTLGEKLKQLRIKENMSQEDLANKLNVSRQAISKREQNLSLPDTNNLILIAKIFHITLDELVNYNGDLNTLKRLNINLTCDPIFYSNNSLSNFFHTRIPQYVSYCFGDTLEIYTWGEMLFSKKKKKSRVMPFCHQSVFVRNEVMKKYKFNLQYRIISDYDLFYRLSKDNHKYEERSVIITKYDATNGISSRYPLSVDLELLKVHRIDTKWYYPLVIIKLYITRGIKNALKFILPRPLMTWIKLHTY